MLLAAWLLAVLAGGCSRPVVVPAAPAPAAAARPPATFPLHVEAGRRYLVDAAGQPFLLQGESAWGLITRLTREQAEFYLEDRRRRGFNTVLAQLVAHHRGIGAPTNAYGEDPFQVAGDFGTPNERYFAHADWVIRKAAEKGMLVLLTPAYTGYLGDGREGWMPMMRDNGASKLREYGRYVGRRYAGYKNIVWVDGGDYSPTPSDRELVRAVAEGIRDAEPDALQTFHGGRGTAALAYWGAAEPWLRVDSIYTDENGVVDAARRARQRSTLPFFLIEARYERHPAGNEQIVRRQVFQVLLSGGAGHVSGLEGLWEFSPPWHDYLDNAGARAVARVHALFDGRPWWTLEPDLAGRLLVRGACVAGDHAVAALSADHRFGLVYVPAERSITVDFSALAGASVRARWIDPASGESYLVDAPAGGEPTQRRLRPPGANRSGYSDWLLWFESAR